MKTDVLVIYRVAQEHLDRFAEHFAVHYHPLARPDDDAVRRLAPRVRGVITNGSSGITADMIAALPKLEIIACVGAGFEQIDVAAARSRGIAVTHGPHTNDMAVADHAIALLLAGARQLRQADAVVRAGGWLEARTIRPGISGKRLGIFGLGAVGSAIARRAEGFGMQISYHNRHPRSDVPYACKASLLELASDADFLVVSAPGGPGTQHMVDRAVLEALGRSGFLVNVGRGSIVSNDALVAALRQGTIAGAALDVVDGEPEVPEALRTQPNVLITPHIAGFSTEAYAAMVQLVIDNLHAAFDGRPVLTPVPS